MLVISSNAEHVLRWGLGKYFELKEESIGPPNIYMGGHVRKVQFNNVFKAWVFGSSWYLRSVVNNIETYLAKQDH